MWETRPTAIYWLIDIRPETIAAGWTDGLPFYCGKTLHSPVVRFYGHRSLARKDPRRRLSERLTACGYHVHIKTMEVVPAGSDWAARERFWISTLRLLYPGCLNISDGGESSTEREPIFLSPDEAEQWRKVQAERERIHRRTKRINMRDKRERLIAARKAERRARLSAKR